MVAHQSIPRVLAALATVIALAASPSAALAAIGDVPPPVTLPVYTPTTDATTFRVLELERTITDLQAEQAAIETRIQVTSAFIVQQTSELDRAERELKKAQTAFNDRAVAMYKFTGYDELAILLSASSWQDLVTRVAVISHILDVDRRALEEASVIASQARWQAGALDGLHSQDAELRSLLEQRVRLIATARTEQDPLITALPPAGVSALATMREEDALRRKRWLDSSVPLATTINKVAAKVLPYTTRTYLVSQYRPRTFTTMALSYSAVCAAYGPGFDGKVTASGQRYNGNDFTCASRTHALGTWLALTRNDKRIVALVTDRGPYVAGRDLELSRAAAEALGVTGVDTVQVEVVLRK